MRFLLTNEYGRYVRYVLSLVVFCMCGAALSQETQEPTDATTTEQTVEAPAP
jgi:hypothetical protein